MQLPSSSIPSGSSPAPGRVSPAVTSALAVGSAVILVAALFLPSILVGMSCAYHTEGCVEERSSWFVLLVTNGPVGLMLLAPWLLWIAVAVPGIVRRWWRGRLSVVVLGLAVLQALICALYLTQSRDGGAASWLLALGGGTAVLAAVLHARRELLLRRSVEQRISRSTAR